MTSTPSLHTLTSPSLAPSCHIDPMRDLTRLCTPFLPYHQHTQSEIQILTTVTDSISTLWPRKQERRLSLSTEPLLLSHFITCYTMHRSHQLLWQRLSTLPCHARIRHDMLYKNTVYLIMSPFSQYQYVGETTCSFERCFKYLLSNY